MPKFSKTSILLHLGLAMATITALAFVSMVSSVIIAEMSQGVATAINQAGSLRMQSYRIASSLALPRGLHETSDQHWADTKSLVQEFETRLVHSRLVSVLSENPRHKPSGVYKQVKQEWQLKIKPLLESYVISTDPAVQPGSASLFYPPATQQTKDSMRARYLTVVDPFVAKIDTMVRLLEEEAESKIRLLRAIHVISLFFTLGIAFAVMYLMKTRVQEPLTDLLHCANRARHGDFSVRSHHTSDDELGQLGNAFNVMAGDLSKMYTDLEERVHEKTADLERSNRSLELLYNTTKRLHAAPVSDVIYPDLLHDIQKLLDVGPGTICLGSGTSDRAYRMATTRTPPENLPDICNPPNCGACFGDNDTHTVQVRRNADELLQVFSTPIKHQEQQYGVLLTEIPQGKELKDWQMRLLEAVAQHIGIAIDVSRRANEGRRLVLLEERSVIARELHDSLAQSLSYLKIQVTRLNATLAQPDGEEKVHVIIDELREGVSSAYRQLRELLTTFRLKMDGGGLATALSDTVDEFNQHHKEIDISLNNRLDNYLLNANEEIHALHVIREALSNVVRHSEATKAHVDLRYDNELGLVTISVDDNGVGIGADAERKNHYGLAIMSERSSGLGGTIDISKRRQGGTRVRVEFRLAAMSDAEESSPADQLDQILDSEQHQATG